MQQLRFPKEPVAWQNYVNRLLAELRVDYSRLWQVLPQLPDPEAGIPYTGPLSPASGCWPNQPCSFLASGSQATVGGCPVLAWLVISGVSNGTCSNCENANGTWRCERPAFPSATCHWRYLSALISGSTPALCSSTLVIDITWNGATGVLQAALGLSAGGNLGTWRKTGLFTLTQGMHTLSLSSSSASCTVPGTVEVWL